MLEKTNSKIFTFLLGVSAFAVATAAAIFSITGLSMLYSGEMVYVAIAMGALEFAKIITASYLYRYWKTTGWGLKTYLSVALLVLMIVTSGGIYGYLTNSYQGATVGLDKINSQTQVLDQRKENLTAERERLVSDIATLRQERQSTIGNRNDEIAANNMAVDSTSMKYRNYRNSQVHSRYNTELTRIDNNISQYTIQLDSTNVRLSRISNDIADKKIEMIDTGVDVGPLVYMARIFDTTMDTVMKWFTLVIVFVFDPLAIALVIALNRVLVDSQRQKEFSSEIDVSPIIERVESDERGKEEEFLAEIDKEIDEFYNAKPVEQAFDDIQKRIDEIPKKRPRFSKPSTKSEVPELIKPLNDLVEDIKKTPTKDIVVPLEPEHEVVKDFVESQVELDEDFVEALNETTKTVGKDEPTKERIVLEPAKSGDIPKEKIIEAVKTVKEKRIDRQNEFFDKMRKDPDKKKSPVTEDEIRDYFEDAVRKVKREGQGMITMTPFQAGGSVSIDHLQDDPDIDYSVQE